MLRPVELRQRALALRDQGLTWREIAEREGVAVCVVATTLSQAKRYGLEVPRSPYYRPLPEGESDG